MDKIIIIGCPGAGKSTFAKKLAEKTDIPLYHLDMIWHRHDRTTISRDDFDRQLREIMNKEKWIIDGMYQRTLPERMRRCDTVFFFDLPTETCLAGAESRVGKAHSDMPWTDDSLDKNLRQSIIDYPDRQLPVIRQLLQGYTGEIIRFTSRRQADDYIDRL